MPIYSGRGPAFTAQFAFGDAAGINPSSNTTYYFGTLFGVDPSSADNPPGFDVPKDCYLVSVRGRMAVVGAGTPSTHRMQVIVRKNATTDIFVASSIVSCTSAVNDYSSTASTSAPVAVQEGDHLYMKWVTPAWSTNPTLVFGNATLYFEE